MKWVTRENANVDRVACPWLIRHFVDEQAEFLFVPRDEVLKTAEREGAIPYDVPGVKLGHGPGRCTFETILDEYGLGSDVALRELGKIVHAADVPSDSNVAAEGAGLRAIAQGFALVYGLDDHKKLALEFPMYDALYSWCREGSDKRE
jgi:hypothetical protein